MIRSRASIHATAAEAIGELWRTMASSISADERVAIDSFFQRNAKRLARLLSDAIFSALGEQDKAIFDITLEDFRASPVALVVRAGSVLSVDPQLETANSLERFPKSHLQMLASVTGAPRSGTKTELAEHIVSVWMIRKELSDETVDSLSARPAADLRVLLDQLHLFKGGNKRTKAVTLVNWRNEVRSKGKALVVLGNWLSTISTALSNGRTVSSRVRSDLAERGYDWVLYEV